MSDDREIARQLGRIADWLSWATLWLFCIALAQCAPQLGHTEGRSPAHHEDVRR